MHTVCGWTVVCWMNGNHRTLVVSHWKCMQRHALL